MDNKTLAKQLEQELAKAKDAAASSWSEFERARETAVAEHGADGVVNDAAVFESLNELNGAYSTEAQKVADIDERLKALLRWDTGSDTGHGASDATGEPGQTSAADRFLASEGYRSVAASGVLGREKSRVDIQPVEIWSREETAARLGGKQSAVITGTSSTSGGAFVENQRLAGMFGLLYGPNTVLGLITNGTTDSDTVEYVRQTSFTNAAAETAEATTVSDGEKPESAMAFEIVTENVRTIAHWIPATKRALADAAGLRTLIESQMESGVFRRLEAQALNGSGSGQNLRGILNQPGINTPAAGGNDAESILKGITAIRLDFLEPNAVVLHPQDYEDIRLLRDDSGASAGTGGYMYGPPAMAGAQTIWGLPMVISANAPLHTAIVGDFTQAILWTREGVALSATDSHADFFVRNLVAILAEGRWAFGTPRPQGFAEVDITAS